MMLRLIDEVWLAEDRLLYDTDTEFIMGCWSIHCINHEGRNSVTLHESFV